VAFTVNECIQSTEKET